MTPEFVTLSARDTDPAVACDRGVSLVPAPERRLHSPDATLLSLDGGSLVARCSCWWTGTARQDGRHVGVIGHYAAVDEVSARALLSQACGLLASSGAATVVGPMDGTTWRRYRLIVDRGVEPPFFLEPDNPDEWPGHWVRAGFAPLATYTSALNDNLDFEDPRTAATLDRLGTAGITIRALDPLCADIELQRIFKLSLSSFSHNVLYTPIAEAEFLSHTTRCFRTSARSWCSSRRRRTLSWDSCSRSRTSCRRAAACRSTRSSSRPSRSIRP